MRPDITLSNKAIALLQPIINSVYFSNNLVNPPQLEVKDKIINLYENYLLGVENLVNITILPQERAKPDLWFNHISNFDDFHILMLKSKKGSWSIWINTYCFVPLLARISLKDCKYVFRLLIESSLNES